ncbi:MAG: type IV secretory system conjugative DNA transfer family protein [Frankiaceae bacterium]
MTPLLHFVALALLLGLATIGLVVAIRARAHAGWRRSLVCYRLAFPRDVEPEAVTAFLTGLSGLAAPAWLAPFAARVVLLEVTATAAGIAHHLLVARPSEPLVLSALRAALPSVGLIPDPEHRSARPTLAGQLRAATSARPLATTTPVAVASAILAALLPLADGERAVVQWTLAPLGPIAAVPSPTRGRRSRWLSPSVMDSEAVRALRAKRSSALFWASLRLGVGTSDRRRPRLLLGRLTAAFHTANAPGAHLRRSAMPSALVARAVGGRRLPLVLRPSLLNAAELTGLMAFPLGNVTLPGLSLGGCRQLAPAPAIPREGRVLALATFPGAERPLALSAVDSLRHLHVVGPTGVGKSTLLANLIAQDMAAGAGVVVIDPKADLVADVLDRVPAGRVSDVIVVDPSDDERPVGLDLLGAGGAPELAVEQVVSVMHSLFRAFWGPRTDDILRSALLTLVHEPDLTLCEVPLLLTDASFRRRLVGRVDDPVGLGPFWGWYEGLSDAERAQAIGPVMNKLRAFLLRRRIRHLVGQSAPAFDLDRALAERRIVLVALSKGLLGEESAALLGSLVVARLWQAVQRRAALPPHERPTVYAHIDEVSDYLHLPTPIDDLLAQARGLGLALTLAHQHLGQLTPALRQGMLANARSRVIFQPAADDAHRLARELAPYLNAADLQGLGSHEIVIQVSTGAAVAPPATGRTLPPAPVTGLAAAARAHSRRAYGADREAVEAALRQRHAGQRGHGPVGRREAQP